MSNVKSIVEIKKTLNVGDLVNLRPNVLMLLVWAIYFCDKHNLPCVLTSLMEDVDGRLTETHRDGRAFDLSTQGWSDCLIHKFLFEGNKKFKEIAAISVSDLKARAFIFHKIDGGKDHIHAQTRA